MFEIEHKQLSRASNWFQNMDIQNEQVHSKFKKKSKLHL